MGIILSIIKAVFGQGNKDDKPSINIIHPQQPIYNSSSEDPYPRAARAGPHSGHHWASSSHSRNSTAPINPPLQRDLVISIPDLPYTVGKSSYTNHRPLAPPRGIIVDVHDDNCDTDDADEFEEKEIDNAGAFTGTMVLQSAASTEEEEEDDDDDEEDFSRKVIKWMVAEERWMKHYSNRQSILLVGEGDFSFSASLARAFGFAPFMVATSLDSPEFLSCNYRNAVSNVALLRSRGCRVFHGVDATKMASNSQLQGLTFDRIVYNFPYAGFFKDESRFTQLQLHRELVFGFLVNARVMLREGGEIHITHKNNAFHSEWKIEVLAFLQGLKLLEEVQFNYRDYPGYSTKCGFGGDNFFNCNPSKTYKFGVIINQTS